MNKKILTIICAASAMVFCGGCAHVSETEFPVWAYPSKCLETNWTSDNDNEKVIQYIKFAYRNGIQTVIVKGLHLGSEQDSTAVELNKYAHILGVELGVAYDEYDLWRWGNHVGLALRDSSLEASREAAFKKEMIVWPCPEGDNYGIDITGDETVCNMIGRMVTSPRLAYVFPGSVESISFNGAFGFFRDMATEWSNESSSDIHNGKYAVVARKARSEGKWFAGGINGAEEKTVEVSLDFLNPDTSYNMKLYTDGDGECEISEMPVESESKITLTMKPYGGFAMSFTDIDACSAPLCVVPQPNKFTFHDKQEVIVESGCAIWADNDDFVEAVRTFKEFAAADNLPDLSRASSKSKAQICLICDKSLKDEAYAIDCSDGSITLHAGSASGAWWAMQTLLQIFKQTLKNGKCIIPAFSIKDSPEYPYRAAHLDCSRHFFSVDEVKTYIDMLAMHKLNTLHWHLTDDQGWRIEIKKYPELTVAGAWRRASQIGQDYWQEDGIPYGPYFYTQDQARDIVAYASKRHVTVIPEIEMPGHAQAAIASYPWLNCKDEILPVRPLWGSTDKSAVCPCRESTYTFYQDVLDEICEIFPSEYIHIGGDEVDFKNWKECQLCQKTMAERGFTKEVQLHGMMVKRIEDYLLDKGRRVIGWDEILDGGVSDTAIIMSWRGMTGGVTAAKMGNDAVLCPAHWAYFDRPQSPDDPVYQLIPEDYRDMLTMRTAYSFAPVAGLTQKEASHIKGVQANVWTEYINDFPTVQWMFVPRISAIAEVGWSEEKTEYEWFAQRVQRALVPLYQSRNYNFYKE